jgi:septal ring-binding cell division protein DamX
MGRLLLAALAVLVVPQLSKACDDKMGVSVRQVGPPIRVVEKKRKSEFILFRGDMRMQNEEIAMAKKEQQQEHVSLMEQFKAPHESESSVAAPVEVAAAPKAEASKPVATKAVAKNAPSKKETAKKAVAKNVSSKKTVAKNSPTKKDAKNAKRTVASASKPKKHRIQRSPASIGPAIVIANQ